MTGAAFDYEQAFAANLGLVSPEEQTRLRQSTVALPGLGGVGGAHLLTLARLGIGRFSISDPDTFELRNFNRQAGASLNTIGASKTTVMAELARGINPELVLRTFPDGVTPQNIDEFLKGSDIVVDGIDFFRIDARRLVFKRARELGIPVITCGPLGFGAAMLVFTPDGQSFDDYFAITDAMDEQEQLARFAVGLAPAGLHLSYLDMRRISFREHRGPSSVAAVNLCAGIAAAEVVAVLLKRRPAWAAPRYAHFDPYRLSYRRGTLPWGNRHPWQRLKLWYLKRRLLRDDQRP